MLPNLAFLPVLQYLKLMLIYRLIWDFDRKLLVFHKKSDFMHFLQVALAIL